MDGIDSRDEMAHEHQDKTSASHEHVAAMSSSEGPDNTETDLCVTSERNHWTDADVGSDTNNILYVGDNVDV